MKKLIIVTILVLLTGCAPVFTTVIKMHPVAVGEGESIDSSEDTVLSVRDDIKITLYYLDRKRIEKENPVLSRSPYLSENKIFFTIFNVIVENNRTDKITLNTEKCVLLDGLGNQYNALTYEYFKSIYPATTVQYYSGSPSINEYTPNIAYTDDYYKRRTVEKTLLKGGDIFPNVRQSGYLVFEIAGREAPTITVIIPSVVIWEDNQEVKKIDFKFKFSQEVIVEK